MIQQKQKTQQFFCTQMVDFCRPGHICSLIAPEADPFIVVVKLPKLRPLCLVYSRDDQLNIT